MLKATPNSFSIECCNTSHSLIYKISAVMDVLFFKVGMIIQLLEAQCLLGYYGSIFMIYFSSCI